MERIERYGIVLRGVTEEDAAFIVKLRTDESLGRFLSHTSPDIEKQKEWIRGYEMREAEDREFYFICEYQGKVYGTTRIYNIEDDCFEVGSWLFTPHTPSGVSVLADIIAREFAFDKFGFDKCRFEVRKQNLSVVKYHKGYQPAIIGEDELNYYFTLTKTKFDIHKTKLIKIFQK